MRKVVYMYILYILSLLIQMMMMMMMMNGDNLVYINVNAESLRFFEAVDNVSVWLRNCMFEII